MNADLNDPRYMLGKNHHQGPAVRALFVCTGGILRSATAAHWAAENKKWNTRSCGIRNDAIPPVSTLLLNWAQRVYCLEREHAEYLTRVFPLDFAVNIKVLDIPDHYSYRQRALLDLIEERLRDE